MFMFHEFVRRGDLVLDVGANHGAAAEAFLSLGAEVVCVEPQKHLADQLSQLNVAVVQAALGAEVGVVDLYCSSDDRFASLRSDWIDGHRGLWDWPARSMTKVDQTTLDELAARFGIPAFIKIDTEGHEDDVIRGLSRPIRSLCFEYCGQRHPLHKAHGGAQALPLLHDLNPRYRYRFAEHSLQWVTDWLTIDKAEAQLALADWGDIYVISDDDL